MNTNEPNPNSPADEHILRTVHAQQRWLRVLTALAVAFWILAVVGSVGVLVCYSIFYAPKEKQIMRDYESLGHLTYYTNSPTGGSKAAGRATPEQALGIHFALNYVVTKAILAVVVTVIVLSCGTLTTLLLVLLNRRVTLKQINFSLAQISEQLRNLQKQSSA